MLIRVEDKEGFRTFIVIEEVYSDEDEVFEGIKSEWERLVSESDLDRESNLSGLNRWYYEQTGHHLWWVDEPFLYTLKD